LVLGLKCVSVVVRTMHALLSSNILDGGKVNVLIVSSAVPPCNSIKLCS